MKNAIRMILVLVIVGLVSGGTLVCVYNYASPLIETNKEKELKEAIYKVLPEDASYNTIEKGGITLYEAIDGQGEVIGYAFKAKGYGYQGVIEMIVAIDAKLETLKGMEVLESLETPGLGAKITEEPFKGQFRGLSVLPEITFTKDRVSEKNGVQAITSATAIKKNVVQAITGATISTKSIVEILNKEIARIRTVFGK